MTDISQILRIAEGQHALITRWQLREIHVPNETTRGLIGKGLLEEATHRVLRIGGSPHTEDQRILVVVLDVHPRAVLSHASSLRRWGLRGMPPDPVDVSVLRTVPPCLSTLPRLHRLRELPPELCTTLGGIPIVRPEYALYQFCGMVHPDRAERAIDAAWSMGLVTGRSMRRALGRLAKRGRNGTTAYRALLEPRGDDYVPHGSGIESRFSQILRGAGERPMRRQVHSGGEQWTGQVDFRDDELPLIVEIQSEMYHTALVDQIADQARIAALEAAGFTVLAVWDTEVWTQPGQIAAKVRIERRILRDLLASGSGIGPKFQAIPLPEREEGAA